MYDLKKMIPSRPERSNKGTFGTVLLVAGSKGMAGAAFFASLAAYRCGAGLVNIFTEEVNREILQILIPEAVLLTWENGEPMQDILERLESAMESSGVVAVGPGLGTGVLQDGVLKYISEKCRKPVIYDADALNLISRWNKPEYAAISAITPHFMEMSRLTGLSITDIKDHVRETAFKYAKEQGIIVVLKDHETYVIRPSEGEAESEYINHTGNSALSKGGSGDVLTGLIAGLTAQGMELFEACKAGVYIHGLAGEAAGRKSSSYGALAREIADEIAAVMKTAEE